jgi:hypothetical protein
MVQVFLKVFNNDNSQLNQSMLNYWLNSKMSKWLYMYVDGVLMCICESDKYNKVTRLGNSFKRYFCKESEYKLIINNIEDNYELGKCIIKNFLKSEFVLDNVDVSVFSLFNMNGYCKSQLLEIIKYSYKNVCKELICEYCNKKFSSVQSKRIHINKSCKCKDKFGNDLEINMLKTENVNLKTENSILKDQLKVQHHIINITQTQNIQTQNIQTNNIQTNNIQNNINMLSKRDKLNKYYSKSVDMDTFIDKYKNDPKYQLTSKEAEVLLDVLEFNGYIGYSNGLSVYLKDKCTLIFNDIHNNEEMGEESILPFVNNDTKYRTHYEKSESDWIVVKNDEKLKKILSISNSHLYNHHNKNAIFNYKETKMVINNLLKKTDICQLKMVVIPKT